MQMNLVQFAICIAEAHQYIRRSTKKTVPAETGTAIGIPEQGDYFMMTFAISRTLLE